MRDWRMLTLSFSVQTRPWAAAAASSRRVRLAHRFTAPRRRFFSPTEIILTTYAINFGVGADSLTVKPWAREVDTRGGMFGVVEVGDHCDIVTFGVGRHSGIGEVEIAAMHVRESIGVSIVGVIPAKTFGRVIETP